MRKIYESQTIDMNSGRVVTARTVKTHTSDETFLFARTTSGLEWINEFKTWLDQKLMMYLIEVQDSKNYVITLTNLQIDLAAKFFRVTSRTIRNSISNLVSTGFLKRISNCNYVANPYTFYKGGTKGLMERIEIWNSINGKYTTAA